MDKINGDVKVNDSGGLFDSNGLIDTLIVDCNELLKLLIAGRYVGFCAKLVEMIQKLSNLQQGVQQDTKSKQERIDSLTAEVENLSKQLFQKGES